MGPKTIEQPFEKKSQAMILKVGTDHQGLKVFKFYKVDLGLFEPCHEKTGFLHMRKHRCRSASRLLSAKLISAFVFAKPIVQSLYFLHVNPKFQVSNYILCLHSLVCVGPGRKPRRPIFSQQGSFYGIEGQIWSKLLIVLIVIPGPDVR